MSAPTVLRCPNGCPDVETFRRTGHAPCLRCAAEGRGVVAREVVVGNSAPPATEPAADRASPARPETASGFAWNCDRDGHVFIGGTSCHHCERPPPANPATSSAAIVVAALVFALVSMFAPRCAGAEVPAWAQPSGGEIAAMAACELLIAVDVAQTVTLLRRSGLREINPLLGAHPSAGRVVAFGAAGGVVAAAAWYALPPRVRYLVPAVVGLGETIAVTGNAILLTGGWSW